MSACELGAVRVHVSKKEGACEQAATKMRHSQG